MSSIKLTDEPQHDVRVNDAAHPVWLRTFDYPVRYALVDQDLEAGRTVSRILLSIVTGGLILGAVGVAAALATL
jgi:hypothetical protein